MEKVTSVGQPHEMETLMTERGPVRVFVHAPASLRDLYAAAESDETFLVFGDERYSFRQSINISNALARALTTRFGVEKGDRVAISMRNFPEWIFAFMAATSIGAIAVAMNSMWQTEELEYGLIDSTPKVLFADDERARQFLSLSNLQSISLVVARSASLPENCISFSELVADAQQSLLPIADIQPDDPATIMYTSGSTGNPKGVLLTQRNIMNAMLSWEVDSIVNQIVSPSKPETEATHQSALLLCVPLFHATGLIGVTLVAFRSRSKVVGMHKWDPAIAAELIEAEHISLVVAPSAISGDLVREARTSSRNLLSLVGVGGGGASRSPEQVAEIDQLFPNAIPRQGWGMTETSANGTLIYGSEYLQRPLSSGWPTAATELRILDEHDNEVEAGTFGELVVRGAMVFPGYWNRPELNEEVFVDGWFRSGDVAYIDEDGYLFIVDRIKDLIIRGGENIGCGQVEAALMMHPDVHEAAAYAVPDERLGEEVGATVYASATLTEADLRAFAAQHLAKFAVPRYITVLTEPLPRTPSGKILKRELRERAAASIAQ